MTLVRMRSVDSLEGESMECYISNVRKRVIIIHGWGGFPQEGWFPWLAEHLKKEGFEVAVPSMPDPDTPEITTWVQHVSSVVGTPDEHTFLVGHSIGCQAILRYLESLPPDTHVGGVVLVAGFFTLTNIGGPAEEEIARPWLTKSINYEKILSHTDRITAIFSDNDEFVPLENVKFFEERLQAKTIIQKNRGHFSGSDGIMELPVALTELLELSR
ncbi:MAG: hypothetical protein G01um101425_256 [Candidatus Peregrinibacteria bacterium Gr01-1014_25]|nr:MAG: hypothetical protein G01um101425_256 [Candidatus Peregrinibacteria bacterium Gr01-1014_25]